MRPTDASAYNICYNECGYLAMAGDKRYWVGVDVGGTKIDIGLVDERGAIVRRCRLDTDGERGAAYNLEMVAKAVERLAGGHVAALGMCMPGPVDNVAGRLIYAPNVAWRDVPARRIMEERLGVPVRVEHDAKAAALGEMHWGRGRGRSSMVYIVIGTGVGGAIIVDGEIFRGETNAAGEIGHATIDYDYDERIGGSDGRASSGAGSGDGAGMPGGGGVAGGGGIPGRAESFIAGPSIERHYRELAHACGQPVGDDVDGRMIGMLAERGDRLALEAIGRAGEALGICIASLAMILDISYYVISSSVAKLGDLLLRPARATVPRYCFASTAERVVIEQSEIIEDAAVLGCYWLVKDVG